MSSAYFFYCDVLILQQKYRKGNEKLNYLKNTFFLQLIGYKEGNEKRRTAMEALYFQQTESENYRKIFLLIFFALD